MILINYKINIITNTPLVVPHGVLNTSHQDDSHALPIIPIHELKYQELRVGTDLSTSNILSVGSVTPFLS